MKRARTSLFELGHLSVPTATPMISEEAESWLAGELDSEQYFDRAYEAGYEDSLFDAQMRLYKPSFLMWVFLLALFALAVILARVSRVIHRLSRVADAVGERAERERNLRLAKVS